MQQSAVVVGHSYIRRLGQFMSQAQYSNLGLREVAVECVGVGGARISRSRRSLRRVIDLSAGVNAEVVVLHIGEDYEEISTRRPSFGILFVQIPAASFVIG